MGYPKPEIEQQFISKLQIYLSDRGEETLLEAYELGRRAAEAGMGEVELLNLYSRTINTYGDNKTGNLGPSGHLELAFDFLAECLASYDMRHRGFRDLIYQLDEQNRQLQEEVRGRRHSEMELIRSKDYFRHLIENALDIITVLNYDATIRYESPAVKRVLGYTPDELIGLNILNYIHPEDKDRVKQKMESVIDNPGDADSAEFRIKHKDGTWRYLESNANHVADAGDGPGIIVNSRDVTERVLAREKLKRNEKQLRKLTARKEQVREDERIRIAREIHDDLGQMLTVLKMDVSLALEKTRKRYSEEFISDFLKEFQHVIGRIDTIIKSVQRITAQLRPEVLDDLGLVEAIDWQVNELAAHTGLQLEFINSVENLGRLNDEAVTAIFRILQETLTNAIRHAKATSVTVTLEEEDGFLQLVVEDDGVGLLQEQTDHVNSLGITGMRERSMFLGGDISFRGKKGAGTKVVLRVPFIGTKI